MSRPQPRWLLPVLAAILLAGALLRVAYLAELRQDPLFARPNFDAELHDHWARGLSGAGWSAPPGRNDPRIPDTPYFRPPGYPTFLGLVYRLAGPDPVVPRAVQFALGLGSALLGFLLGRRLGGPAVGAVVAAGLALGWWFVFFEGELLDPALLVPLVLLSLLALDRIPERPGFPRGLGAGLLLGVAVLVRPNVLLFLPAAVAWAGWALRRRKAGPRFAPTAVGLALGAALAIAPATVRNALVSGEFVLVSSNGGINLLIGNNPRADGVNAAIPRLAHLTGSTGWTCFDYPQVLEGLSRRVGRPVGHAEASRLFAREAWRWIAGNPGAFLALTAKRAALFFGPLELGDRDPGLARRQSRVLRLAPGSFPVLLGLAVLGAVLLARDRARREIAVLAGLFVAAYTASFLPFFFNARYRVPTLPPLLLFAAYGAVETVRLLRAGRGRALLVPAVSAAVALALSAANLAGARPRVEEWSYQRGCALRDAGDLARAVHEFRETVRLNPAHAQARVDLAVLLGRQGRPAEAEAELREALRSDPAHVGGRFNLAQLLVATGRGPEAMAEYARVLETDPREHHAHLSLGTLLLQQGRAEEGLAHYRAAYAIRPDDPMVPFVLGRGLLGLGRPEEAVPPLREAVRLDPADPVKRRLLARAEAG